MSSHRRRSVSPSRDRRRTACQLCSKRKMKCDLLEPKCTNCKRHDVECVPVARAVRPRPTHERIDELQGENTRLQCFLHSLTSMPAESSAQAISNRARFGEFGTDKAELNKKNSGHFSPVRTRSVQHPSQDRFSAHGPTSALFDSHDERDFGLYEMPNQSGATISEAELSERATSSCAEARHMEVINLASGKLEFDDVSPDLAMHLLALHWNRQHFAFLIPYRPLFTRDMACGGPYFSKLLLNAIFFSVSKFSDRREVYDDPLVQNTAGSRFLRRVKELLGEALDQSSVPTIQAMLLLTNSLFASGHQSAAWIYSGIAMRMIFDLGLHYDYLPRVAIPSGISPQEFEIRRRIIWSAFIIDKIISLYQGRPVSFAEERMHVPHRFVDLYEEQEVWMPFASSSNRHYPGQAARAISTFSALCSLAVIMGRIITQIYADRMLPDRPAEVLDRLSMALDRWKKALPPEITYDPSSDQHEPPPHVLSLTLLYHTLVALLYRPFVEASHGHSEPGFIELCWARCEEAATAATKLLEAYRRAFTLTRAPYLISYTTFVAATIHVRIAAQRGTQSEAGRLLSVCLEGLEENAATNPGVRKMFSNISGLMERLNVISAIRLDHGSSLSSGGDTVLTEESLDLSAIIRSFGGDLSNLSFSDPSSDQ